MLLGTADSFRILMRKQRAEFGAVHGLADAGKEGFEVFNAQGLSYVNTL
jgi:hypothetical protein